MKKILIWGLLLAILCTFVACGDGTTDSGSSSPQKTNSPTPATPSPIVTPENSPTPSPALSPEISPSPETPATPDSPENSPADNDTAA